MRGAVVIAGMPTTVPVGLETAAVVPREFVAETRISTVLP
jgi:hypothetical protein